MLHKEVAVPLQVRSIHLYTHLILTTAPAPGPDVNSLVQPLAGSSVTTQGGHVLC